MTVNKVVNGNEMILEVEGRLDSTTSPILESCTKKLDGISMLVFDFAKLDYVSSAGLRILLASQKVMDVQGRMAIRNVNEEILELFDMTGFSDILTIEK